MIAPMRAMEIVKQLKCLKMQKAKVILKQINEVHRGRRWAPKTLTLSELQKLEKDFRDALLDPDFAANKHAEQTRKKEAAAAWKEEFGNKLPQQK